MTDTHTPTLERLHAFEELGKRPINAYLSLGMFAAALFFLSHGDPNAFFSWCLIAGLFARDFDTALSEAHCEYSTLRAEGQ